MATNLQDLVQRLEHVVQHFEGLVFNPSPSTKAIPSPAGPSPVPASLSSPALQAYDSSVLSKFGALLDFSSKIDGQITSLVTFN
jgi:hypothetical protein